MGLVGTILGRVRGLGRRGRPKLLLSSSSHEKSNRVQSVKLSKSVIGILQSEVLRIFIATGAKNSNFQLSGSYHRIYTEFYTNFSLQNNPYLLDGQTNGKLSSMASLDQPTRSETF